MAREVKDLPISAWLRAKGLKKQAGVSMVAEESITVRLGDKIHVAVFGGGPGTVDVDMFFVVEGINTAGGPDDLTVGVHMRQYGARFTFPDKTSMESSFGPDQASVGLFHVGACEEDVAELPSTLGPVGPAGPVKAA